jgi:hypothetical protein
VRPTVCAPLKHLNFRSEWESSHLNFSFEKCMIVANDATRAVLPSRTGPDVSRGCRVYRTQQLCGGGWQKVVG